MKHYRDIEKFRKSVIKKVDKLSNKLIELSETADTFRINKITEIIEDILYMFLDSLYQDICNAHRQSKKEK